MHCDVIPSASWPTGLILGYDIGVNLTWVIKKGGNPMMGIYSLVHNVSDITSWDNTSPPSVWWQRRPGGHLFPVKSDLDLCRSSCTETSQHTRASCFQTRWGISLRVRIHTSTQHFSCIVTAAAGVMPGLGGTSDLSSKLSTLNSQLSALSVRACGQQWQTGVYDLKCHKELFYIKEREKKEGGGRRDCGYTEPYSQGDPQSLVWLQSDCETRRIKRIITQTSQWSPITPWHMPLRRFISHRPDYCVCVCLRFL